VSTGGVDDSNLTTAQKSAKEMRERVASHFDEWARVQDLPPGDDRSVMFLQRLERTTFLREDSQEGFLRVLVELAVTHCLGSEKKNQGGEESSMSFAAVDAYCRLVTRLARRPEESPQQRLALFGRALVAIVRTAMRDTDERGPQFNPKPYFRALSGLLNEMRAPDAVLDSSHPQVLAAFASALLALQPMRVPGFAFAWLELVSHRCFMPRLLLDHAQKGRPLLQRLICAALKFLEPYLRECNLTEPVKLLYKGVLRVFLVLLHDFPEFLCDNHVFFLDATPTNCVQLRNLVLSAFPRNMRLPDPFTPNLKIDLLPEISQEPTNAAQFVLKDPAFNQSNVKVTIDNYLSSKNIANASQVANQVRDDILLPGQKAMQTGTRYDVPMMNALVLYVGVNAIVANQNARNSVLNSSSMELLQKLCDESLDAEGRYYFMSAVANQLRYPNSHTHYFSCVTLCLFQETKSELVREQITRVLLERLVVNRPHPWGLLVTFVELIKNPRYNFWAHGFTRCAPEIERLFESVARSCVKSPDEGGEAGQGQQQDGVAT
jgi:CCR4-NOT transcription complex subunit 1